jgi:hypothetical protein
VVNKSLSLQQVKEELMKIRGHLVDMPLDFLIVRPPKSWRLFTDEIGGERFDGSGKSSFPRVRLCEADSFRTGSL